MVLKVKVIVVNAMLVSFNSRLSKTNSLLQTDVHRHKSLMARLTLRVLGASVPQMSSDTLIGQQAPLAAWSRQHWTGLIRRNHGPPMSPAHEEVQVSASAGLGVTLKDVSFLWAHFIPHHFPMKNTDKSACVHFQSIIITTSPVPIRCLEDDLNCFSIWRTEKREMC